MFSPLFYLIMFCFVLLARIPVPPSGRLPAAPILLGSWWCARPHLIIFLCHILFLFCLFFYLA